MAKNMRLAEQCAQQRWSAEHWLLQYDLMFGRGYALQRMGLAGLSGVDTGK